MSCNNVQILNFNHNIVEVGADNKIIITDQIKCNSVTIPQPITNILQINSPGPQGAQGPPGENAEAGGSNTQIQFNSGSDFGGSSNFIFDYNTNKVVLTGSMDITGSLTVNTVNVGQNTLNFIDNNSNILNSITANNSGDIIIQSGSIKSNSFTGSFTGSLQGTSSYALSSSYLIGGIDFSTLVTTSSFNAFTSSYNTGSFTGSFKGDGSGLINISASAVIGLNLSQITSGSYSASIANNQLLVNTGINAPSFTGSLYGTASWATNTLTASYINSSITIGTTSIPIGGSTSNISNLTLLNVSGPEGIQVIAIGNDEGIFSSAGDEIIAAVKYSGGPIYKYSNEKYTYDNAIGIHTFTNDTNIVGNTTITGSLTVSGSSTFTNIGPAVFSGSVVATSGISGSFTGSFKGDGNGLTNISASAVVGLNLSQITSGSYSASISNDQLLVNTGVNALSFTGSLQGTSSWAENYTESDPIYNAEKGKYLTTGSINTTQTISGSLVIDQNLTVLGSSSIQYITSSQLNIGTNLITVNTATPAVRFGGLAVYDSGSTGTGRTGSLLWDSQENVWIYTNPSGAAYDGGMLLTGPRNTNGIGNEVGINTWYAAIGDGSHHMTSSQIWNSGSLIRLETDTQVTGSVDITNILTVNDKINTSFIDGSNFGSFGLGWSSGSHNGQFNLTNDVTTFSYSNSDTGLINTLEVFADKTVSNKPIEAPSFTGSFTGSLEGTAATASYVSGSIFDSNNLALSASHALTASFALNGGGGGSPFFYQDTAPDIGSEPITGSMWVSSDTGVEYNLIYDGDSYQWVQQTLPIGPQGPQGVSGTNNIDGLTTTTLSGLLRGDGVSVSATTVSQSLGYVPEDVANKSIDGIFAANSDTLYPSQKAVKTYVDNFFNDEIDYAIMMSQRYFFNF
jgi:hypothetical protein